MSVRRQQAVRIAALALTAVTAAGLLGACGTAATTASSADTAASKEGVATAKKDIAALQGPISSWPQEKPLSKPVDLHGKTVMVLPLGDNIPIIHGAALGATQALEHLGATVKLCDGKFDPTAVAGCLKQAGDQKDYAVLSMFIDYAMAGNAFETAVNRGVKVLIGAEPPSGGAKSGPDLAFYDNTERINKLDELTSEAALADKGTDTNVLWLKLMDSSSTKASSAAGVARFKKLCPACGLATTEFTTANLDKVPSAVSAALVSHPNTNTVIVPVDTFVPAALQGIQSAGFGTKVDVISTSSDLAGLQRVQSGRQTHDLGTPVIYEGYKLVNALMQLLAGDPVAKGNQIVTRDFTKANIGDLKVTQSEYFTSDWFGDDSFKEMFYKAWAGRK